jgi:hypothetical protein
MKENYNIYPRGVTLSVASPTTFRLNMPENAVEKAVFWLSRGGFVYKTYADAMRDTAAEIPKELVDSITLLPGERLFYKQGNIDVTTTPGREVPILPQHLLVVSCIEFPFCLPVPNQKPGNKSTLWISRTYNAYHTYREALNDKAGSKADAVTALQQQVKKAAVRKTRFGWLVVLVAVLFIIYVFKNYGKQNKYAGSREVVPALPE